VDGCRLDAGLEEGSLMGAGFLRITGQRVGLPLRRVLSVVLLCSSPVIAAATIDAEPVYHSNSWETLIPGECRAYFDGCNNCAREPGKVAACTRMACAVWQKPRCRDDEVNTAAPTAPEPGRVVDYTCEDGKSFSVIYHEYLQDDQRIRLTESEILLRDDQTHTLYRLQRQRSASGEKYGDGSGFRFFGKGDEAMVIQEEKQLYAGCKAKP
jgi:membrane-bound inhibitor of C-type lysozyme